MKNKKRQIFAALLSSALIVSNIAVAFPQTPVFASEGEVAAEETAETETSEEPDSSGGEEVYAEEPDRESEPENAQEPAHEEYESAAQDAGISVSETSESTGEVLSELSAAGTGENDNSTAPVTASGETAGEPEGTASPDASTDASSGLPLPGTSDLTESDTGIITETEEESSVITILYKAGEGGSVSADQETISADDLANGAAPTGSEAVAAEGYEFINWTASDETVVSDSAFFVPSVTSEMSGEIVYTANFTVKEEPQAISDIVTKEKAAMPAQDFEGTAGSVRVRVHADEGNFPDGTEMNLRQVSTSSILGNDSVQNAVGEDREVVDAAAVDITFDDKDGNEIEPVGTISVNMTTSSSVAGESHEILHIDDNGNASTVTSASANGASFDAGEFSIYVITGIDTADPKPAIATYKFYDADGNVIAASTQMVKDGETVYMPTTPEKSGSKFLGWSYKQNMTSLQDGDPGDVSTITASVTTTGDVKLYPVFQEVYYVFFLDAQGRVSTTKEGTSNDKITVSDVTIPLRSTAQMNPSPDGIRKRNIRTRLIPLRFPTGILRFIRR